ncbi:MAG: hypothetical protein IPM57_00085 [Oligoflexia bacterium]|nr:hypothetical protein [Oligoflexia bacterium]
MQIILIFMLSIFSNANLPQQALILGDMVVEKPKNKASLLELQPWEDGILPLEFADNITEEQRKMFFSACNKWAAKVNVKCIVGQYKNRVVEVTKDLGGCWAFWGMGTHFGFLRRKINLGDGCWYQKTILHEIGHAFGLIHEHQRPDRDKYIKINMENIGSGFLGLQTKVNFDKQEAKLSVPYDFLSIMHYNQYAFSKNNQATIEPQEEFKKFLDIMGNTFEISEGDIKSMLALYGSP